MTARLDKWLWAVRLFKTRALAADAIRAGSVEINARPAKPAREVHAGETVTVQQGLVLRTLRVVGAPVSRTFSSVSAVPPHEWAMEITPRSCLFGLPAVSSSKR